MVAGQDRRGVRLIVIMGLLLAAAFAPAASAPQGARWCLGLGSLGPVRTGMTVEQVLGLADWPGLERAQPAGDCWYMHYRARGSDFDLMILRGTVVRIELNGTSRLHTFSGAAIGSSESELRRIYGARLDVQPHKYVSDGHTMTWRSPDGAFGLRFETARDRVTAIQSGPWEQLNYVEGCG
jgi:hypothetical protein